MSETSLEALQKKAKNAYLLAIFPLSRTLLCNHFRVIFPSSDQAHPASSI